MAPLLVPAPQEAVFTGRRLPDDLAVTEVVDPGHPAQGYELTLGDDGITLAHADEAGVRYGRATLDQLRRQGLAAGRIRDWPDLVHRGFMLDISRDRVPDRACLLALLDRLDPCLAGAELSDSARRIITERRDDLVRALRCQRL